MEQISVSIFLSVVGSLIAAARTARIGCEVGKKGREKEKENTTKLKSKGKGSEGREVGRLQHRAVPLPPSQERCVTRGWCKAALGGRKRKRRRVSGWGEGREKCGTYSSMSPPAPSLRSSPSSLSLLRQKGNAVLFAESQN